MSFQINKSFPFINNKNCILQVVIILSKLVWECAIASFKFHKLVILVRLRNGGLCWPPQAGYSCS